MLQQSQKTVFYSWQSDLPKDTNQKGIRNCLQAAIIEIDSSSDLSTLILDEATSKESGSPEIAPTILKKILKADIFVCDVSIINSTGESKKTPNPNVLIELGFAVAILGWERILMLFNKAYGELNDLPFDLDRKRVKMYTIKDKNDKSNIGTLTSYFKEAIGTITENNPTKGFSSESKENIQYQRDINNIENLFSQIDIDAIDSFIENLPNKITESALHYFYSFKAIYTRNSFFIYNHDIKQQLDEFDTLWTRTLNYDEYYSGDYRGEAVFYIPGDVFPSEEARKAHRRLAKEAKALAVVFKKLIKSIREQYHEIQLEQLSAEAASSYRAEQQKAASLGRLGLI
jgi:hypothetical protein